MTSDRTFELGLVMAGAISAGAYTAGVLDFLFEALDAYNEEKQKPGWDGPIHDVRVPIMSGASAGGMTSAICALHAFHDLAHVWPGQPVPPPEQNRLYSSWVTDISLDGLLETSDLDAPGIRGLKSVLCCDVLDKIVDDAFTMSGDRERAWIGRGDDHSLRVRMTLTNLRGAPYSFQLFGSDTDETYGMLNHGDYFDFTVGRKPGAGAGNDAARRHEPRPEGMGRLSSDGAGDRRLSSRPRPSNHRTAEHGVLWGSAKLRLRRPADRRIPHGRA